MIRKALMGIVVGLALASSGAVAYAEAKAPATTEEHFALAKKYQDQADGARKQATEHREMAEAAKNKASAAGNEKRGQKDPYVQKMEKHCASLVQAADKLADENQKAADFHTMRGKELQGK